MVMYALIGLSLVLLGIVGLQFTYTFYISRIYSERRKHLQALEHRCSELTRELKTAERRIKEQDELIACVCPEFGEDDDSWAEVIGER